jgi:hypothetical protein
MTRWHIAFILSLGTAIPAQAQAPAVSGVFPAGGATGSTFQTTISGSNLADVHSVFVSGGGVTVEKLPGGSESTCPVQFTVAPGAELGHRELRVVTKRGASNAGRIWVGRFPSIQEKEPNDLPNQAQLVIKAPRTLDGRVEKATDVDRYIIDANKDDTWVFAVNAAGHASELDPYLTLYDSRGRSIDFAMDTFGRDPRLVHRFRWSGRYTIEVRDSLFRGGTGYTYRLTVGELPIVTRWSPMSGAPGQTVKVSLAGINLENVSEVSVAIPADTGRELIRVAAATPRGPTNPFEFFVEEGPETPEAEPNDDLKSGLRAPKLPLRASGRIGERADRDVYIFTAKEKQTVLVDVQARRIGSRLDSAIRVLDAAGKELAANDDAVGKDSRLSFTAPTAGEFSVEVRSLTGRGGDDLYYWLEITDPPPPDFQLTMTPDNPTVPAGASAVVTVSAQRAGYTGDIALRVENLPPGVTASPATIPSGQNSTILVLTAPAAAAPAAGLIRVFGTATINRNKVERLAAGQESYQPPLATPQQARTRETELSIAAAAMAPPYTLMVTPGAESVSAGGKLELTVKAARAPNYKESIAVTVAGLPPNITASALTINGDKTEGKITLTINAKAAMGPAAIAIQGNAKNVLAATPLMQFNVTAAK